MKYLPRFQSSPTVAFRAGFHELSLPPVQSVLQRHNVIRCNCAVLWPRKVEREWLTYFREEIPGCSHEKTNSAIPGNTVVSRPSTGPAPKATSLNQNSVPSEPGSVLVT